MTSPSGEMNEPAQGAVPQQNGVFHPFAMEFKTLRQQFLAAARAAGAEVFEYAHPLHGPDGGNLVTDVALVGPCDAAKLMVIVSGTHGVEGPFGSTCQTEWLRQNSSWHLPEGTAVLFIHLINPWGTAWSRRVNEDNVDLNRNFISWNGAAPENADYAALHDTLVCHQWEGADRDTSDAALKEARTSLGQARLVAIVEAGQYAFADGLFYGGDGPVWSNRTLRDILVNHCSLAQQVIVFDLHTGAGPYGYPALLSVASADHSGLAWGKSIFGPAMTTVVTGPKVVTDTGIAANATGYVSDAVRLGMPQARVLPLVIECGTLESAAMMECVQNDNWLHLFGKVDSHLGQRIKTALREAFIPKDPDWQAGCLATSLRYFDRALAELKATQVDLQKTIARPVPAPGSKSPETAPEAAPPTVEVSDLHKSFGLIEVLKGVSLAAQPGEVVSMIGASGSGKSTLLRCINMLEKPNSGTIAIEGEVIRMKTLKEGRPVPADRAQVERIRSRVGMVFQNFNLWPHMTVLENLIEAPIHVLKEAREDAIEHAHALLKKVGLSEKPNAYPAQLSGGQQQRAAIARTLAMRPRLMLFDEPTSALDPELVGEVLRVIRQLAEEGNTMILVTHEMQFAREVSSRVKFLHMGRVEEEGHPEQLFSNPTSERLRQFLARVM